MSNTLTRRVECSTRIRTPTEIAVVVVLALASIAARDVAAQQEPSAATLSIDTSAETPTGPPATVTPEATAEKLPRDTSAVPATDAVTGDPLQALDAAQTRFLRLRDEDRQEEATAAALQVAQLTQAVYGPNALNTAAPLINLALVQGENHDLAAAEQNYRSAISVIELHEGRLSLRLINPLIGLGHIYNRSGMNEQAIDSFQQAMRINHVNLGFYNFEQFTIQDGLTESYIALDDFEEATFYQEAQLEIHQRKLGQDNPEIVPAMYKLAEWYNRTGNLEESILTYRSADRLLRDAHGDNSASRSEPMLGLAQVYQSQGNPPAAISTLRKALRLINKEENPDVLQRAKVQVALGDVYAREGMPDAAHAEYMSAWADLSIDDAYLDQRADYFSLPIRVEGGALNPYARNARGKSADHLRDGYVLISYAVSPKGRATNVKVIESDPTDIMDKSVTTTYRRSYFRPRLEDGIPVITEGLLVRHDFKYLPSQETSTEPSAGPTSRHKSAGKRLELPDKTSSD